MSLIINMFQNWLDTSSKWRFVDIQKNTLVSLLVPLPLEWETETVIPDNETFVWNIYVHDRYKSVSSKPELFVLLFLLLTKVIKMQKGLTIEISIVVRG